MEAQSSFPSKIMRGNSSNFVGMRTERKNILMLSAWTQTTGDDFETLRSSDSILEDQNRALREQVRQLESKLQHHTELLSQIHATSARLQQNYYNGLLPSQTQPYEGGTGERSPPTPPTGPQHQILTPPNSVICAPVQPPANYKIYTAPNSDVNDSEAIEIRLAAESLNSMSSSADSDRLEICLTDEQQHELSEHHQRSPHMKAEEMSTQQVIKRRKLELQEITDMTNNIATQPSQAGSYKLPPLPPLKREGTATKTRNEASADTKPQQMENVMVSIGPNNTCVPAHLFENINWNSSSLATRKLLVAIFDRETLATHSMTGKPSPAFKDQHKPLKQMLDPLKIQDIIFAVTRKCAASEKEVRSAITTKCADENKMMRIQKTKRRTFAGFSHDKENMKYANT